MNKLMAGFARVNATPPLGIGIVGYFHKRLAEGVLDEFDRVIGLEYLKALHINDSKNPCEAHKDRHACIGEGYIGKEAIARILAHPKLQGLPCVLETPQESLEGYGEEIEMIRGML